MRDRQKEDEDETRQTAQEVRSTDGRDGGERSDFPDGRGGRLVTAAAAVTDGRTERQFFAVRKSMYKTAGRQKGKPPPPPSAPPTDWTFFGREITRRIQILPRSESEKRRKREIESPKRLCDHAESLPPLLGVPAEESHS